MPTDDLVRLRLQPEGDADCWLAGVNSICILFLVVGLVGLKMPQPKARSLTEFAEVVPVMLTSPDSSPHLTAPEPAVEPPEVQDTPLHTPELVVVVATDPNPVVLGVPADRWAIPVPARFPAAPSAESSVTAQASAAGGSLSEATGSYPWPRVYPPQALLRKQQGEVLLLVTVAQDGTPSSVMVENSSGHAVLDGFAAGWVRDNWKWPAGPARKYHVPFKFCLQR